MKQKIIIDFEQEEKDRPQFIGIRTISPVNGSTITYFPPSARRSRITQSIMYVIFMVMLVISIVACIFFLKIFLHGVQSSIIPSTLNSIQIQVNKFILFLVN